MKTIPGEDNYTLFQRLTHRHRSTYEGCWYCKKYPNCGMCGYRAYLKPQKEAPLSKLKKYLVHIFQRTDENRDITIKTTEKLPYELQKPLIRIIKCADENRNFTPAATKTDTKTLTILINKGYIVLQKKNDLNPGKAIYKLADTETTRKLWKKHHREI